MVRKKIKVFKTSSKPLSKSFQALSFARLLPNIATVMALCIGLTSVRFALQDRFEEAVIAILVAAVLDAMDGRLARLLGASSDFGAELDSLSDFISFGVAPALVTYMLSLKVWQGFGWVIILFFAVCMSLRLARFNISNRVVTDKAPPAWAKQFFTGVPAPAGAMLGLLPLMLFLATGLEIFIQPIVSAMVLILTGILMISRLPTFSFKTIQIPPRLVLPTLLLVGLFVAFFMTYPWLTMSVCLGAYVVSFTYSYKLHNKLKFTSTKEKSVS